MERKIIAVMGITLLIGLGIGYGLFYILFEYTGLRTGETKNDSWNTILSFTGSDNEITDSFSIKTDQWRINWHILPEEKWLVNGFVRDEKEQETDRQVYVVSFPFKWNGYSSLMTKEQLFQQLKYHWKQLLDQETTEK